MFKLLYVSCPLYSLLSVSEKREREISVEGIASS